MHLLEADVSLIYIRDLLGHTSVATTEIYAKTNPRIKEEQLKKHSASVAAAQKYSKKQKEGLIDWLIHIKKISRFSLIWHGLLELRVTLQRLSKKQIDTPCQKGYNSITA